MAGIGAGEDNAHEASGKAETTTALNPPPPPPRPPPPPPPPPFGGANVEVVENILEYRFRDAALVEEALTHASFFQPPGAAAGPSYERLEFMGDAVLKCVVAQRIFNDNTELSPGPLTRLLSANADTEKLARAAVAAGLHRFLRHKSPYLDAQIDVFTRALSDYPIHSNGLLDTPKVLADVVEALVGAVFLDSGSNLETVWRVFERLAEPLIGPETLGKHPKSELYELCQKKGLRLSFLKEAWTESTAVEVVVDGQLLGRAMYRQKKDVALNRAAKAALDRLKLMLAEDGGAAAGDGTAAA